MFVWEIWQSEGKRLAVTLSAMVMRGRKKAPLEASTVEGLILEAYRHGMMAADGFIEAEIKAGNLIRKAS